MKESHGSSTRVLPSSTLEAEGPRGFGAVRFSDEANLPTRFGRFRVVAVQEELRGKEHLS